MSTFSITQAPQVIQQSVTESVSTAQDVVGHDSMSYAIFLVIGIILCLIPPIVATCRNSKESTSILWGTILLSIIPGVWFFFLIWAFVSPKDEGR